MKVNAITKNFEDYECDEEGCELQVKVEIEPTDVNEYDTHLCDRHARELAEHIVKALSAGNNAGGYHYQGSDHVSHPLTNEELRERAKEHNRNRS